MLKYQLRSHRFYARDLEPMPRVEAQALADIAKGYLQSVVVRGG